MKYQLIAFSMIQYVYHSMYKRSFYYINRRDLYQQTTMSYYQKANVTDMFRDINKYTRDQKKHFNVKSLDELILKDIVDYQNEIPNVMYELKDIYDTTFNPDEKILFNDLFKHRTTIEILDKNQWSFSYYKKTLRSMKRKISKSEPYKIFRPAPDLRCVLSEP